LTRSGFVKSGDSLNSLIGASLIGLADFFSGYGICLGEVLTGEKSEKTPTLAGAAGPMKNQGLMARMAIVARCLTSEWMPLGLIAVVMVFAGCGHSDTQTSIPIPIKPAQNAYFKTQFQDESQFIVETIATDLAEQIFYAKNHRLPDSSGFSVRATETPGSSFEQPTYDLQVTFGPDHPPVETELKITGPIWSPEPYSGLVSALAREAGLNAPAPARQSGDTDLLQSLTDSSAITIETENKKLSKALEADFSNPLLHEQAALLLGAFTLRDHSG
jgi:hypothetical protein